MKRLTAITGIFVLVIMFMLTGCYTRVMIQDQGSRVSHYNDYSVSEEPYTDYYDSYDDAYDADIHVTHDYYLYGDFWYGDTWYDPFWASSSWHSRYYWDRWFWRYRDPWMWDSWYYGYSYRHWPYTGGGWYYPSYHWNYMDPYYAYYSGYYSSTPQKRRNFDRRQNLGSDTFNPTVTTGGAGNRLSKAGTSDRRTRRSVSFTDKTSSSGSGSRVLITQGPRIRRDKTYNSGASSSTRASSRTSSRKSASATRVSRTRKTPSRSSSYKRSSSGSSYTRSRSSSTRSGSSSSSSRSGSSRSSSKSGSSRRSRK